MALSDVSSVSAVLGEAFEVLAQLLGCEHRLAISGGPLQRRRRRRARWWRTSWHGSLSTCTLPRGKRRTSTASPSLCRTSRLQGSLPALLTRAQKGSL